MSNREKLLEGALELFATRGYDAVGVQEIADHGGVQKPTLYHYFGSKTGLLQTLLAENLTPFLDEVEKAATYDHNVLMSLRGTTATYFNFASDNASLYRLFLALWFAPPTSEPFQMVAMYNQRQQEILETLFYQASLDHGNMKDRQRAYAATFLGMINTYIALGLNGHVQLDQLLVQNAVHQFMHGIFS
ncbi:MAG: TetR/AcrR family transcriptional regulator [Anaerolineaceae bacterium]|nr:TetR/AcrR family transcriptional regulator [Anaerolineaceae bacterium]